MKKKIIIFVSLAVIALSSVFLISGHTFSEEIEVSVRDADFAYDITDKNKVVGNNEHVFVARVIKQIGTQSSKKIQPHTQFQVEVLRNIKGELKGRKIIDQFMGYYTDEENQKKYLFKFEGQELLQPGKVYLFATKYSERGKFHIPTPTYGEVLMGDEINEEMISEYENAFKNQEISDFKQRNKNKNFIEGRKESDVN